MNKDKRINLVLLLGVVALTLVPLLTVTRKGEEEIFAGADGQAEELITQIRPEYKPWASSLWEPPSGEIESLLFALQAAIGAGFLGYYLGLKRGQMTGPRQNGETHASH
jgi:cobalt/nickel transport protein